MFTRSHAVWRAKGAVRKFARSGDLGDAICIFRPCVECEHSTDEERHQDMLTTFGTTPSHCDSSRGTGRFMACRPIGFCPPERVGRGWSAGTGARRTRVSEMRMSAIGAAAQRPSMRTTAGVVSPRTRMRGKRGRIVRRSG